MTRNRSWPLTAVAALSLVLAAVDGPATADAAREAELSAGDLYIVDCLLPSKVRRLGRGRTYLAPRRPLKTTAVDCRIRGGEYTEPDQATHATSLQIWLPQAEDGVAEAQFYVGQIFERGLGTVPDYSSAAVWYRRAAEQGYGPAQISLGHFYEQGLGVDPDPVAALNWYRQAAGLAADLVVLQEADYADLLQAQAELEAERAEGEKLEREVEELRRQLEEMRSQAEADEGRNATLDSLLERLEGELEEQRRQVAQREESISELEGRLRAGTSASATPALPGTREIQFGRYHALVIGNRRYARLAELPTAEEDARRVAALLEEKYGFEVELLVDADRYQTMTALNRLRESLTENDNLLVYYAGHGRREESGGGAYWQPVDAEPDSPANWIPNAVVTEHLDLVPARHVFVVADSVYAGLRTRSSVARLPIGMTEEQRFHHIRLMLEKRSRLVLASGGERPASSAEDGRHSRFSGAFLDVLEQNDGVLEASAVYERVVDRLADPEETGDGAPEFAMMRWARNDVADFFFVARR